MSYTWDLTHLCSNNNKWYQDIDDLKDTLTLLEEKIKDGYKDSSSFIDLLKMMIDTYSLIEKLYCYKRRCLDLDGSNEDNKKDMSAIMSEYAKYQHINNSFEQMVVDHKDEISELLKQDDNAYYQRYIELIFRKSEHIIEGDASSIYQEYQATLKDIKERYQSLLSSLKFGTVEIDGEEIEITRTNFDKVIENEDRAKRKEIYEKYQEPFKSNSETLAELYISKLKNDIRLAQAEGYSSLLAKKLFELELEPSIIETLIAKINANLDIIYDYLKMKKLRSGYDTYYLYDQYQPSKSINIEINFDEALVLTKEALKILGSDYTSLIDKMVSDGWIDVYPSPNKRTMSSTSISYNGVPYILINYLDNFISAKTLCHEIGHAAHVHYSKMSNGIEYFEFNLFLTEVVAKVNELLFYNHLLSDESTEYDKESILSQVIGMLANSLYTQVQLTEFEHTIIRSLEEGKEVGVDTLNKVYQEIYQRYNGTAIEIDEYIPYGWCKIPHLVLQEPYYLYQYSLGLTLSTSIVEKLLDATLDIEVYLDFLKTGNRLSTTESLETIGIDLTDASYIDQAIIAFKNKVKALK